MPKLTITTTTGENMNFLIDYADIPAVWPGRITALIGNGEKQRRRALTSITSAATATDINSCRWHVRAHRLVYLDTTTTYAEHRHETAARGGHQTSVEFHSFVERRYSASAFDDLLCILDGNPAQVVIVNDARHFFPDDNDADHCQKFIEQIRHEAVTRGVGFMLSTRRAPFSRLSGVLAVESDVVVTLDGAGVIIRDTTLLRD